jgi:restriction system protein
MQLKNHQKKRKRSLNKRDQVLNRMMELARKRLDLELLSPEEEKEEILLGLEYSRLYSEGKIFPLYKEARKPLPKSLSIYCSELESEMIQFFRRHPEQMYSMPPRKFEELIAAIFKNHGFKVQLTPETRDGGIDIIAVEHSNLTGESIHLIECKRYAPYNYVGIGVVQRLLGVVTQTQATRGIVVTTSFFTSDAKKVGSDTKHILTLRDYDLLVEWLKEICP